METAALLGRSALIMTVITLIAGGVMRLLSINGQRKRAIRGDRLGKLSYVLHIVSWLLSSFAMFLLIGLFLKDAFQFAYVAERSHREMATIYKITALWAGQEGSLLLWLWMQVGFGLFVARRAMRGRLHASGRQLDQGAAAVIALISAFFAILVAFVADPFVLRLSAPIDGSGLNPILQSYWMATHPVMLYLGYVGLSVPFAYALSSLMTGQAEWIKITRRWSLTAWTFLSVGILYGARWAYEELGWGGYWGWDPVENASFMPWLVATALIHSGIIEEKRGMLKRWNHFLVFATYLLTLFGTFVTRSGILSSVHAFVESDISPWFIGFLGMVTFSFLYLYIARWDELKDERPIVSPLSKESSFLAQNVVFLATMFAIFWGTVFPLVASALGRQVTVGTPYFNRVTGPLFWAMIVLMGIGPIISWRRASIKRLREGFTAPVINAVFMTVWLLVVGVREIVILLTVPAVVFVLTTIIMEFVKGVGVRKRSRGEPWWLALYRLMNRSPGRYGGYVVHFGVLLLTVGIAFSQVYQEERNVVLAPGEEATIGSFSVTLHGVDSVMHREVPAVEAELLVRNGRGQNLGYLKPAKRFHFGSDSGMGPITQSAIYGTWSGDLYAILAGWEPFGSLVGFKLYYNPLVWLIWAGGGTLVFGGLFSLWPRRGTMSLSESAAVAAIEVADDFKMGKVEEEEYAAVMGELSPRAEAYLEQEKNAIRNVLEELQKNDKENGEKTDKDVGLFLSWVLAAGLAVSFVFGGMSPKASAQTSVPTNVPMMDEQIVIPGQTMVVRYDSGRLHVFDHIVMRHIGDKVVSEVSLPLPAGAIPLSLEPDNLQIEEGVLVDAVPLSPGETRRYVMQYELRVFNWPYALSRPIVYPTSDLLLLMKQDELDILGVDIEKLGEEMVAGQPLDQYRWAWIAPDTEWHVTLKPGPLLVGIDGSWTEISTLPLLAEIDRFPGDWLVQRAMKYPRGATIIVGLCLLIGAWMRRKTAAFDRDRRAGEQSDRYIVTLVRTVARLDLAHESGTIGDRIYRRQRKRAMNRLVQSGAPIRLDMIEKELSNKVSEGEKDAP